MTRPRSSAFWCSGSRRSSPPARAPIPYARRRRDRRNRLGVERRGAGADHHEPSRCVGGAAAPGTKSAFLRRLEAGLARVGHLVRRANEEEAARHRIDWAARQVSVIDIHNLHDQAKRFVVGVVLKRMFEDKEARGTAQPLVFTVLDELNRYAPRSGWSPIKEVLLDIAERGRSLGIILIGAQQTVERGRAAGDRQRRVPGGRSARRRRGGEERVPLPADGEPCPGGHSEAGHADRAPARAPGAAPAAVPVSRVGHPGQRGPRDRTRDPFRGVLMRFLHTGDWHVGKTLKGRSRQDEHEAVLAEILDIARRERVDALLIGGDTFDSVAPDARGRAAGLLDARRVCGGRDPRGADRRQPRPPAPAGGADGAAGSPPHLHPPGAVPARRRRRDRAAVPRRSEVGADRRAAVRAGAEDRRRVPTVRSRGAVVSGVRRACRAHAGGARPGIPGEHA